MVLVALLQNFTGDSDLGNGESSLPAAHRHLLLEVPILGGHSLFGGGRGNFLEEYAEHFPTVEVDQWFWSLFAGNKGGTAGAKKWYQFV